MEQVNRQTKELTLSRVFNAPRELVFEAFSTCEHLKNWWGPRLWPTSYCEIDFRPGGVWRYCLRGPNGEESWGKAVYREIVKPERIIYNDAFSDKDGNIAKSTPQMLITVTFDKQGAKTKLTSVTQFDSVDYMEKILKMGVVQGINETWDRLEEHLATLQQEKPRARKK
jgi:uncharacterized protein YndB with AHSA1/START domain